MNFEEACKLHIENRGIRRPGWHGCIQTNDKGEIVFRRGGAHMRWHAYLYDILADDWEPYDANRDGEF